MSEDDRRETAELIQMAREQLASADTAVNGQAKPQAPVADPNSLAGMLLAHLRTTYDPLHRREQAIWSRSLGRAVDVREASTGPPSALLVKLIQATDCPKDREGNPNKNGLLRVWNQHLKVAWADLLATLPEETAAAEVDPFAEEELRRHLAALLGRVVSIGRRVADGHDCDVQARSLLDCCLSWAVPGMWGRIRSYWLWCRLEGEESLPNDRVEAQAERHKRLRVALRIELAGQVNAKPLTEWSTTRLTRLMEHYGIGTAIRIGKNRARAIELARDFLDDLVGDPITDREPGEEG